ncbi:DUF4435 domain-containing protein [Acinetobacter pittii]|uniref:DUF4435 domain-containing protein n=1 Tax=Acinetobacter pittii TaxID=48296 RepID=A0A4Y3J899_ACIPI|nr:DUF4435 domain-containing protein [Acinetobacter pittii]MZY07261.1 DUF4435 domain-containing protein [Acinetobacter pittii]GEA68191.1 hypothetical protein PA3_23490 [Acinetobacter pittii]
MFNRVNELLAEAEEAPLYIIEFGKAKNQGYEIFVGIEGDDQPYYDSIVRSKFPNKKIAFIRCGFRENVLGYIEYLKKCDDKDYRDSIFFGFVDHDYDEIFVPEYIDVTYVTPCYSYENFYTTVSSFQRLLESKFHVKNYNDFHEDFEIATSRYLYCRDQFLDQIKDVECIVRTGYLMEKKGIKSKKRTHVSKLKLTESSVSVNGFALGYTQKMQEWIDNIDDYIDKNLYKEIRSKYDLLSSDQLNNFIRGKIIFDFYIRYIGDLLRDESDINSICFKKRNSVKIYNKGCTEQSNLKALLNVSLKKTDLVEATSNLAPFADIPNCLLSFLDRILEEKVSLCA